MTFNRPVETERRRLPARIVAATHNAGKLREIRELLSPDGLSRRRGGGDQSRRTGGDRSYIPQNAALKAASAARTSGEPALAYDSGLCLEVLGRRSGDFFRSMAGRQQGFRKRRCAGSRRAACYWRRIPRSAAFGQRACPRLPDGRIDAFEGRVDGDLVFPRAERPGSGTILFSGPTAGQRTFGEMTAEEKHGIPPDGSLALSHRARAFQKFAGACL